ncbi:carbon-nitrogen hydrolase family protein [Campylobacter sp. faydin G-24]|uniref:Carbon-nitrogen hydrolase family protein n=1 Tax=Campylobacter anatolicus TaxID=2829105 RepID=A0ABS5HFU1_9BACT|nr:carbon-nitrogen hydrolase family protein [Campylobacter anatolicus]MBR8463144.1 carbon-nitrogen hydrolase family protein [Campylobacter anatolicus]
MSKICALQLPTLPLSEARLDYYLKICADESAKLVVLGEYVLNSFFKELEMMPKNMIKAQSEQKIQSLANLAKKYELTIIAPIVSFRGGDMFKSVAKFSPSQTRLYDQQILMPYSHWNESKFYANKFERDLNFAFFTHERLKVGVLSGFETHFDTSWAAMSAKKVDVVIVPCANTFQTQRRWEELLKMRAFTHNVYVLRVNRIGTYKQKDTDENWSFYGDSFLVTPFGEISQRLGEGEEMLVLDIDKRQVSAARKLWGFDSIVAKFE